MRGMLGQILWSGIGLIESRCVDNQFDAIHSLQHKMADGLQKERDPGTPGPKEGLGSITVLFLNIISSI